MHYISLEKTSNNYLRTLMNKITAEIQVLNLNYQQALSNSQALQYQFVRNQILLRKLPIILNGIQQKRNQIVNVINIYEKQVQKSHFNENCDNLLEIDPRDKKLIQFSSEKQCLKQVYSSLKMSIGRESNVNRKKLQDQKNKFKIVFSRMFENQTNQIKIP